MIATLTPAQQAARMVDSLGPEALAKAQAYTTGNHWLLLGGVLVSLLVAFIMVRLKLLDRIAARFKEPRRFLPTLMVSAAFLVISTIIALPWTLYTDWQRERAYGLSSQPLGDFLGQMAISEAIGMVLGGLFLTGVYALIRRSGQRWWLWSGGLAGIVTLLGLLAGPPLIEPLFNDYKPVPPGEVRTALEAIAEDVDIRPLHRQCLRPRSLGADRDCGCGAEGGIAGRGARGDGARGGALQAWPCVALRGDLPAAGDGVLLPARPPVCAHRANARERCAPR
jgi:STE24 endopeptidase